MFMLNSAYRPNQQTVLVKTDILHSGHISLHIFPTYGYLVRIIDDRCLHLPNELLFPSSL